MALQPLQPHRALPEPNNTPQCLCCKGIYGLIIMAILEGFWSLLFLIGITAIANLSNITEVIMFLMDAITFISFVVLVFCIRSVSKPERYSLNLMKYSMLWYVVQGTSECITYGLLLDYSTVTGENAVYQTTFYGTYFGLTLVPAAITIYMLWTWYAFIKKYKANTHQPRLQPVPPHNNENLPAPAVVLNDNEHGQIPNRYRFVPVDANMFGQYKAMDQPFPAAVNQDEDEKKDNAQEHKAPISLQEMKDDKVDVPGDDVRGALPEYAREDDDIRYPLLEPHELEGGQQYTDDIGR